MVGGLLVHMVGKEWLYFQKRNLEYIHMVWGVKFWFGVGLSLGKLPNPIAVFMNLVETLSFTCHN